MGSRFANQECGCNKQLTGHRTARIHLHREWEGGRQGSVHTVTQQNGIGRSERSLRLLIYKHKGMQEKGAMLTCVRVWWCA
eukprot:2590387-Alexandrium_andersonii.AAC.1